MPQAVPADVMEEEEPTKLKPDGDPSIKLNPNAVSPRQFVEYAASLARSHNSALTCQFLPLQRTETERQILEALNSLLSAKNAFGILSESPFLRPVTLLRPVQFAFPVKVVLQYSDPENMVRRLRDLADQKVTSLPLLAILSGTKPNAASLGFCTDFLTYSFNLELDINIARLLVDQLRNPNSCTDKYRLILRLAWATTGFYMPGDKSNPSRVLASEVLPRCLSVRVDRRNVTLPEPTFHEGQAQNFGHRLRFAIDITDKIRFQTNSLVCCQHINIDLTWLHAPLQDHAIPLLEMVGSGSCTSILNHLLNLPLVQITLDRVHPIPEFVRMFSSAVSGMIVTDPPPGLKPSPLPSETPEALIGVYDFCRSPDRVIAASETLAMVKSKLTSLDDLQSDGWIPVSLLCPLALTRIEIPVRSVNCEHLQCFDLSSYLTINKKRPRWSCPVCSSPAPFRDLRRDDFFVQLIADQSLKDAEMAHVDANGHWREAFKPIQSDSSAVISIKDSISVITSDNPRITAVPYLLNGPSTMKPCILESNFPSTSVTPMEPDASHLNDCILPLGDSNEKVQNGCVTQSEQPVVAHPTPSSFCRGQTLPDTVTDERSGKRTFAALDFRPRTRIVDTKGGRRQSRGDCLRKYEELCNLINCDDLIGKCQALGLLAANMQCHCGWRMRLEMLRQKGDGVAFRCGKCRRKRALRTGSIFERSHLGIRAVLKIMLAFVKGFRVNVCKKTIGVSHSTAVMWYKLCRNVCSMALMNEKSKLGGPGVEIQVHETLISRRNRNGRRQFWLLGMYDTKTRKVVFEHVSSWSWSAVRPVVTKWIKKGSVLITDEREAYKRLPLEGYTHCTVNLSKHLKDPTTGKPTNAIEVYWNRLKRKLHRGGAVRGRAIWEHICEVQYRLWYGLYSMDLIDAWNLFLSHVAQAYPVKRAM